MQWAWTVDVEPALTWFEQLPLWRRIALSLVISIDALQVRGYVPYPIFRWVFRRVMYRQPFVLIPGGVKLR